MPLVVSYKLQFRQVDLDRIHDIPPSEFDSIKNEFSDQAEGSEMRIGALLSGYVSSQRYFDN